MRHLKLASQVLVLTFALAGMFCYAECAVAAPAMPSCHGRSQAAGDSHDSGQRCCPPFEASLLAQAAPVQDLVPADPVFAVILSFELPQTNAANFESFVPAELSPPHFFLRTHAIHAPPVLS